MKANIDFEKEEIEISEETRIGDLAYCLNRYFPEVIWGNFKILINGGTNKEADIGERDDFPF